MPQHPAGQSDEVWRRRASSFGSSAAEYAEHRPGYSPEAVEWLLAGVDGDALEVLDLGAGTGAVTGALLALGHQVVAVDADRDMVAELGRRHPRARALVGSAETIPLADGSMDAVLVGTAFHWFDLDLAGPEVARVLRPGGVAGLLYNDSDDTVEWVAELDRVGRTSASTPPNREWRSPAPLPGLGPWREERFPHTHRRTAASLTATIGTHSHTRVVTPEEREQTLGRIRAFLDGRPETSTGEFDVPMTTVAYRAPRS